MLNSLRIADHERVSRLGAVLVCVIGALVCAWLLVRLLWLILAPGTGENVSNAGSAPPNAAVVTTSPIAQWHLFGNPQSIDLAQRATHAPPTILKLILRGTLALAETKEGIAMIADEHGSERSYKVGEIVSGGAKLVEVYTDHVVLSHDGIDEALALPQPDDHASATLASGLKKPAGSPAASSVPPGYAASAGSNAASASIAAVKLPPAVEDLARQVHIEPVFDGGKISGARLSGSGAIAALMNQAGLKPTDVVTAVNGTSLGNVSNPQQLIDSLKNSASVQVTVQRDGKPATLTLPLH